MSATQGRDHAVPVGGSGTAVMVRMLSTLLAAATIDRRTGTLIHDAWRPQAVEALRRSPETERCALLMLDLDRFKDVNDTYGHAAGDLVLGAVAQAIRDQVRDMGAGMKLSILFGVGSCSSSHREGYSAGT